jgi:hypothetical protein
VATSSSSTKRAARLAQKGKGQKVRFQGGTLFPLVVAIVLVLGFALIVYSRQSRPAVDASPPTIDDHWHVAYGFYLCDEWFMLTGDLEEQDSSGFVNTDFARTGVHSHDDGLIHWHAFSAAATGGNATLGLFLDNYGVELTNDKLQFPESQRAALPYQQETGLFESGETQCDIDGELRDGELKVITWDNFSETTDGTTFIADFENIRVAEDAMVIAVAFVPSGTDVDMPPWAPQLPELGAVDSGQLTPDDLVPTTLPDDAGAGTDTGVTDTAVTDTAVTDTAVPDTAVPDTSGG